MILIHAFPKKLVFIWMGDRAYW